MFEIGFVLGCVVGAGVAMAGLTLWLSHRG